MATPFTTSSGFIEHSLHCTTAVASAPPPLPSPCRLLHYVPNPRKLREVTVSAAKFGGISIISAKNCKSCSGKGAIECPGCKGTGRNKKNGNIFERWKCFECQGFGLKSCPSCGKGGLTPEQRGER